MGEYRKSGCLKLNREYCPFCSKPKKVCICQWLTKIDNEHHITVLRHTSEKKHALNTAGILSKCLTNLTLMDGETFNPSIFSSPSDTYLVYPGEHSCSIEELKFSPVTSFILLDGSWKKTNKILFKNNWLEKFPRVRLPVKPSRYFLRKQKKQGFSTLEAACELLSFLEQDCYKYQPVLNCLDKFMQLQAGYIDPDLFEEHFGSRVSKISSDKNDSKAESPSGHNNPDDKLLHPRTQ